jgi:AraC-like DNA-binding protein
MIPLPSWPYTPQEIRLACRTLQETVGVVKLHGYPFTLQHIGLIALPAFGAVRDHRHAEYEGLICLQGRAASAHGRALQPGSASIYPPHVSHAWQALGSPCLFLSLHIQSCLPLPRFEGTGWPIMPELVWLCYLAVTDIRKGALGWEDRAAAYLTCLTSSVLSLTGWNGEHGRKPIRADELLQVVDHFLLEHMSDPLTLEDVAAHVGMSTRSLVRRFPEVAGESVKARLQRFRLEFAARMLVDTAESISIIGARVGMDEVSYFCRRFREFAGMTPYQYRLAQLDAPARSEATPNDGTRESAS